MHRHYNAPIRNQTLLNEQVPFDQIINTGINPAYPWADPAQFPANVQLFQYIMYLVTPVAQGGAGYSMTQINTLLIQAFGVQGAQAYLNGWMQTMLTGSTAARNMLVGSVSRLPLLKGLISGMNGMIASGAAGAIESAGVGAAIGSVALWQILVIILGIVGYAYGAWWAAYTDVDQESEYADALISTGTPEIKARALATVRPGVPKW